MTSNLATELREGTKHSHTLAENTAFMKCFLKGIVDREAFRKLVANLYLVYDALETGMRANLDNPVVKAIYFPELERKANLEADLAYYYGDNWREQIPVLDAGKTYVDRINQIAANHPELLVAHAYVRYMGDLSGGQSLKKIIRAALNLPENEGTGLHDFDAFPTPEDRRNFKFKYRDALNELSVNPVLAAEIVEEANYAFRLNRDVVHELEPDVKAAIGDRTFALMTNENHAGSTEDPASKLVAV